MLSLAARHRRRVHRLMHRAWTREARHSVLLRRHLRRCGLITPHFAWSEMADTTGVPVPRRLRRNARRHCWNLERLRHRLGVEAKARGRHFSGIHIDGPYRTPEHNRAVGGASLSRHMKADASDHFVQQVQRWERETGLSRGQILAVVDRVFSRGGVGNENSGTLHLDSRGARARFITWRSSR